MDDQANNRVNASVEDDGRSNGRAGTSVKVQKFGGSSIGSVEGMRAVMEIIREARLAHRTVVVVSALEGVTDALAAACAPRLRPMDDAHQVIDTLWTRHHVLASGLLGESALAEYEATLESQIEQIIGALGVLRREGGRDEALRAEVMAVGERLSVALIVLALQETGVEAVAQDATELIRTDSTYEHAHVDLKTTGHQVEQWFGRLRSSVVPVVTGFIGADEEGAVTMLGRGGSDYSAALLASGLKAAILERWTDVDGLYTADPRRDDNARHLSHLVMEEALAMNQAGQLGMHPKALDPLITAGIPTHVRSTREPQAKGTFILPRKYIEDEPAAWHDEW